MIHKLENLKNPRTQDGHIFITNSEIYDKTRTSFKLYIVRIYNTCIHAWSYIHVRSCMHKECFELVIC